MSYLFKEFFDERTSSFTYVVYDNESHEALVVDPVLDFDQSNGEVSDKTLKPVIQFLEDNALSLQAILETHVHADHLTGSAQLKKHYPKAKSAISKQIVSVQSHFSKEFKLTDFPCDGSQFDMLLEGDQTYNFGNLKVKTIATPGHTQACLCYHIGELLITGDTIFMPDFGTGRCDFPGGSAEQLFHSIHKLYEALEDETKVLVGHDYQPGGRELRFECLLSEQKENNIHIKAQTSEEEFVSFRTQRDATLSFPKLLYPSLQVNMRAGNLPEEGYLRIPIKN